MKKIRIFLEYIAAFLIIFFLLFVIASVVVVKFYGDELQKYTMEIINDQIDTKISVEEVGISIFRKFPNTSVFFNDVTVWSGHSFRREEFPGISTDTLFVADRLYLQFNILDLLRKKYAIKSLEARNGKLNILIDSSGKGNYSIEKGGEKNDVERFIEVKGFVVRNIDVQFFNLAKKQEALGKLKEVYIEGHFAKENYLLKVAGEADIGLFNNHNVRYISNKVFKTEISLNVVKNHYSIEKGDIYLGELSAGIYGEFLVSKEIGLDIDLHFKGKRIDIEWVSTILANSGISTEGITGKGIVDMEIDVTGLAAPTITPHIEASFLTQNAQLDFEEPYIELRAVDLKGSYSNGPLNSIRSTTIRLESFSSNIGKSHLIGSGQLENLISPKFSLQISGDIIASDIVKYFPDLPVKIKEGRLTPDLLLHGSINRMDSSGKQITLRPEGTIDLSALSLSAGNTNIPLEAINGRLEITSDKIVSIISGFIADTDFDMNISVNNPYTIIDESPSLTLMGTIHSTNIDIDKLIAGFHKEEDGEKTLAYPENIRINLDFQFDKITRGDISTKKVSGTCIYKYPGIFIDPIYLETMNGFINCRIALVDLDKTAHQLSLTANFRQVEIQNLFKSFNNFGQEFLTYDNIKGSISGDAEFLSAINNDFSMKSSDITSRSSFIIENGELMNFKPIIELSGFLNIDKMDHIQFSTISNTILINDNLITIPAMDIKSSALNINASGTHSFDNSYEYHLAARLSEILFNKAKSNQNSEFDIALDKEDKRTIFLTIYDKGDGMMIDFDDAQARKKIRQDFKEEKTELKLILNEEFGLFKKDAETHNKEEIIKEPVLRFEFPDDESPDSVRTEKVDGLKWWQRKKEQDKKPEFEFVIDDSNF